MWFRVDLFLKYFDINNSYIRMPFLVNLTPFHPEDIFPSLNADMSAFLGHQNHGHDENPCRSS